MKNFTKNLYSIFLIILIVFSVYLYFSKNIIYCDTESISDLYFNMDNDTIRNNSNNDLTQYSSKSENLNEKFKQKLSWYLFYRKFIPYSDFKKNWYPSRSVKQQIKNEVKDFFNNPYKYTTNKREWLLVDNCQYYIDNPNGTFFVQGIGYLNASYVHNLTVRYKFVVHNNRFVYVKVKNFNNIIRELQR